jgi:ferric-dicitrate binding protein FerR (iron transport regulator)
VENYKELFVKYLKNECTHEELSKILGWLKDPANGKTIEQLIQEDWSNFDTQEINISSNKTSFETLKQRIAEIQKGSIKTNQHNIGRIVLRIAASLLLPVAIGWATFYILQKNIKPEPMAFNEITAPLGSKTSIQLADGTKVWLNSGSKLRIPQKFEGNYREVTLTGEAFFDVKRDTARPFLVKTSKLNIKVLGTSFNVKAYPEEGTIETTLVKGLVTITKTDANTTNKEVTYLKPNQRATFVKETGNLVLAETEKKIVKEEVKVKQDNKREEKMIFTKNIDTEPFVAWKDDKLVFKYEDFESLCIKLQRWYGVEINIKSEELKKYHYTGVLQRETINDVIKILKLTMPIRYEINHSVVDLWIEK